MTAPTVAVVPFDSDRSLPCRQPSAQPEWFFEDDDPEAIEAAKKLCERCPRRAECLAGALRRGERFGIFAGYTTGERDALVRKAKAKGERPTPPRRFGEPGALRPGSIDPDRLRRLFNAAHAVLYDGVTRRAAAAEAGTNLATLSEVVTVLEWAPDVAADAQAGRVPLAQALRYARAVREWSKVQGVAA